MVFDPLLVIYVLLGVWLLSDVSYSDECWTKKYFQYAEDMFPLLFAILKFCSTKHLFNCYHLILHAIVFQWGTWMLFSGILYISACVCNIIIQLGIIYGLLCSLVRNHEVTGSNLTPVRFERNVSALSELSINSTVAWVADRQVRAMLCASLAVS